LKCAAQELLLLREKRPLVFVLAAGQEHHERIASSRDSLQTSRPDS
jgi:hypothetical protein